MFFLPWVSQAPQVNRLLLNNWHHLVSSGRQLPRASARNNSPATSGHAGDVGPTPGLGRSPEGRKGNPLHCSCLGNPTHRGEAWRTTVQEIAKSRTPRNDWTHMQHEQAFHVVRLEKSPEKYYKCRFLGQPPEFQFSWCVWRPPKSAFLQAPSWSWCKWFSFIKTALLFPETFSAELILWPELILNQWGPPGRWKRHKGTTL